MPERIWRLTRDGANVYFSPRYFGPSESRREPTIPVISGFDTETALCHKCGKFKTISLQAAVIETDPRRQAERKIFHWVPCGADPMELLMRTFIRLVGKRRRPIYAGAHNLGYDLGSLLKGDPAGYLMLRGGLPSDFDPDSCVIEDGNTKQLKRQKVYLYKQYVGLEVEFKALVPNSSSPFAELHLHHGSREEKEIGGREAKRYQLRRHGKITKDRVKVIKWGQKTIVHLRDTMGFVKTSLARACKAFKLDVSKLHHPPGLGEVDFRPHTPDEKIMQQVIAWIHTRPPLDDDASEEDKEERDNWLEWLSLTGAQMRDRFEEYGGVDALAAAQLLLKLWELQEIYGARDPAVSAPSFSAARVREMGRAHGLYTGMGGPEATQAAIDAYRGGRVGGIYHGALQHAYAYDIRSSYPYAMLFLPAFSPDHSGCLRVDEVTDPDLDTRTALALSCAEQYPCTVVKIHGWEHDTCYPAFLNKQELVDSRGRRRTMLMPQAGEVAGLWVTGAELLAAMSNGFDLTSIEASFSWYDNVPGLSPFKRFVEQFYSEKANHTGARREMAKLALNSLYGKLIEMRRPDRLGLIYPVDDGVFLVVPREREGWAGRYYWQAIARSLTGGRLTREEITADLMQASTDLERKLEREGEEYEVLALPEIPISDGHFGTMAIPPAAAVVTGIARARLHLGMVALGALYWATDSLFTTFEPEVATTLLANIRRSVVTRWGTFSTLPKGVSWPQIGAELGDLEAADSPMYGVFAGIGRYYFEPHHPDKDGKRKPKFAYHGLPHLDKKRSEVAKEVLEQLARGEVASYQGRPHPIKARGTSTKRHGKRRPAPEDIGRFVSESYEAMPEFDSRLRWEPLEEGGFNGRYLTQAEIAAGQEAANAREGEKWERRQAEKLQGAAYATQFRKVWLAQFGRIHSADFDQADLPRWCRMAKGSRGVALDTLTAGSALDNGAGFLEHPLAGLGEYMPGWVETEEELLRILWGMSPAPTKRKPKKKATRQTE